MTAYYDLKSASKHGSTSYSSWNSKYFRLPDAMVVFTDSASLHDVQNARSASNGCTAIIVRELEATHTAKLLDWEEQINEDPEGKLHSYALYIIWNQKSDWLLEAASTNYFNSTHFFWTDSGQFRDDNFLGRLGENEKWVKCLDFPAHRIVLLSIEPFDECELRLDNQGRAAFITPLKFRLGGGNFGGDAEAIRVWRKLYYKKLLEYHNEGIFVGKDQPIMGSVCLENSDLCTIVDGRQIEKVKDIWFAMQVVLHDCQKSLVEHNLTLLKSDTSMIFC